ncbi:MAG: tryptophan--tRNA ligase [Thermoplasmatales archaeon]|nr:tryptophan--tRNA ligase [Thermoplasmatales archaeon]MCW6170527.1 tryptophan--tRNA ligase [Thermoplasmatales archaeon]
MAEDLRITPWSVSGSVQDKDYDKIANEFGAKIIDERLLKRIKKITGDLHPFLLNGIFYAHRDLDLALDDYSNGKPFYLYTGRGPSGEMHLGHILPFMFTKWLQEKFNAELIIQITDDEKYLFREIGDRDLKEFTHSNIIDILSLGFDPDKTHILIDSEHSGILYNNAIKVARNITASSVKAVFGLKDSDNIGKYFFTSIQAVPAFILSYLKNENIRCLIPYGIDQDPHFKLARDVLPKLGYYKPSSIISKFIPSLQGSGKMSSSDPNSVISLNDSRNSVRKKLMKYAFSGGRDTAEEQRKYGANPDIDFSFNIFRIMESDQSKVSAVHESYMSGEMLSGEMKSIAAEKISEFLEILRSRREDVENNLDAYMFDEKKFN